MMGLSKLAIAGALAASLAFGASASAIEIIEDRADAGRILKVSTADLGEAMEVNLRLTRGIRGHGHLGMSRTVTGTAMDASGKIIAESSLDVRKNMTYATLSFAKADLEGAKSIKLSID